jgi:hypothetical protein
MQIHLLSLLLLQLSLPLLAGALVDPGQIPVAVLCCCAPDTFRAAVLSLSRASGFQRSQLFVFQDAVGKHPAMDDTLESLVYRGGEDGAPDENSNNRGLLLREQWYRHIHPHNLGKDGRNTHVLIARHYKHVLTTMFDELEVPNLILLEEDLLVSKDFLHYFAAVAPLVESDPTLYLASAWNDQGFEGMVLSEERHTRRNLAAAAAGVGTNGSLAAAASESAAASAAVVLGTTAAGGSTGIHRADHFPGLGWLLPRKLWSQELKHKWPGMVWDVWLRLPEVRKGRHVLVPEVPRTKHTGRDGSSMHLVEFDKWFTEVALFDPSDRSSPSSSSSSSDSHSSPPTTSTPTSSTSSTSTSSLSSSPYDSSLLAAALNVDRYRQSLLEELRTAVPLSNFWPLFEAASLFSRDDEDDDENDDGGGGDDDDDGDDDDLNDEGDDNGESDSSDNDDGDTSEVVGTSLSQEEGRLAAKKEEQEMAKTASTSTNQRSAQFLEATFTKHAGFQQLYHHPYHHQKQQQEGQELKEHTQQQNQQQQQQQQAQQQQLMRRSLQVGFGWVETLRRRADVAFDEEDYEAAEGVEERADHIEQVLLWQPSEEEAAGGAAEAGAVKEREAADAAALDDDDSEEKCGLEEKDEDEEVTHFKRWARERKWLLARQVKAFDEMLEVAFDTDDADAAGPLQDIVTALEGEVGDIDTSVAAVMAPAAVGTVAAATASGKPEAAGALNSKGGATARTQAKAADAPSSNKKKRKQKEAKKVSTTRRGGTGSSSKRRQRRLLGRTFVACYEASAWRALANYLGLWPPLPDIPGLPRRGLTFEGVTKVRWTVHYESSEIDSGIGGSGGGGDDGQENGGGGVETAVHTLLLAPSDSKLLLEARRKNGENHEQQHQPHQQKCFTEFALDGPLPPPPRRTSPRPRHPHVAASLRVRAASPQEGGQSCSQICSQRGMWCAPDFLPGGRVGVVAGGGGYGALSTWNTSEDAVAAVDNCPAMVEQFGLGCRGGCEEVNTPELANRGISAGMLPALYTPSDSSSPRNYDADSGPACLVSARTTAAPVARPITTTQLQHHHQHTPSSGGGGGGSTSSGNSSGSSDRLKARQDKRRASAASGSLGGGEPNSPSFSFNCAQTSEPGFRRLCPCVVASVYFALSSPPS